MPYNSYAVRTPLAIDAQDSMIISYDARNYTLTTDWIIANYLDPITEENVQRAMNTYCGVRKSADASDYDRCEAKELDEFLSEFKITRR